MDFRKHGIEKGDIDSHKYYKLSTMFWNLLPDIAHPRQEEKLDPKLKEIYDEVVTSPNDKILVKFTDRVEEKGREIIASPEAAKDTKAREFLEILQDYRHFISEWHLVHQKFLRQHQRELTDLRPDHAKLVTDRKYVVVNTYNEKLLSTLTTRRKLLAGDAVLSDTRARSKVLRALKSLTGDDLRPFQSTVDSLLFLDKTDHTGEVELWAKSCYQKYDAAECFGSRWDPTSGSMVRKNKVDLVHIIPYKVGYSAIGKLFGGDGWEHMWSVGNGVPMKYMLKPSFLTGAFFLLPVEKREGPYGVKICAVPSSEEQEVHGRELVFSNDHRPELRYMYLSYWLTMVKAKQENWPGWEDLHGMCEKGELWTMPGKYVRSSILRAFVADLGGLEIPERLFTEGAMDEEEGEMSSMERSLAAKELQGMFLELDEFLPEEESDDDDDDW